MITRAARIWMPNISTASGMRATDGIGRRNSISRVGRAAQEGHQADDRAEDDGGERRDGRPIAHDGHGEAERAPEREVAQFLGQPREHVGGVRQVLRADQAERRDELPGDEEADKAGDAQQRLCAANEATRRGQDAISFPWWVGGGPAQLPSGGPGCRGARACAGYCCWMRRSRFGCALSTPYSGEGGELFEARRSTSQPNSGRLSRGHRPG